MPTLLTSNTPKGPYPGAISPDDLDITLDDLDIAIGNDFVASGRDMLLFFNAGAGAQTFTIVSTPGGLKRTQDISNYSLGPGEYAAFKISSIEGWVDGQNRVNITGSSTDIKIALLRF